LHDDDEPGHSHGAGALPRHFYAAVTTLLVDDVVQTVEYYRDALGFEVDFVYGDPPAYGSVSRNDAIINFTRSEPPGRRNSVVSAGQGNGVDVLLVVSDVDEIYAELKQRGVKVLGEPVSHDYGMRDFQVEDCNQYRLALAEELEL
jgi:predicted enzyme related to lactoylglutathione lyase